MDLVSNANYRGAMKHVIELPKLRNKIPNSILHKTPHQLVVKDIKGTILFFRSGKFRVMGCIDELEATFLAYTILIGDKEFSIVTLQSYTSNSHLGFKINLEKWQ